MTSSIKAWLLLGGIFIVGVVTGCALTFGLGPGFAPAPPHSAKEIKNRMMARLTEKLSLTPDQKTQIGPILEDAARNIQSLHRDEIVRGSQILQTAHQRIAALLTPEQKAILAKMEADRQKRFSDHLRPWGSPRDGAGGPPGFFPPPDADDDHMSPPSSIQTPVHVPPPADSQTNSPSSGS